MLAAGRETKDVLEFLAATLTNRLMHAPSQRLREAAERGDVEVLRAAQALFGIDKSSNETRSSADGPANLTSATELPLVSPVDDR
jgi:glutamyl-tRNA reductase